jgi:hypothetical protein
VSNSDSKPLYVIDTRKGVMIALGFCGSFLLVIVIVSSILIPPFWHDLFGLIVIILSLILAFWLLALAVRYYESGKRMEFYDDFVRLFYGRKKEWIDVKYSELILTWKVDRRGFTRGTLTVIDEKYSNCGKQILRPWQLFDVKGKNIEVSLFTWLQSKTKS